MIANKNSNVLLAIAFFRLIKALILLAFGICLLFIFTDVTIVKIENWFEIRELVPYIYIAKVNSKFHSLIKHKYLIGSGCIFYSLLFFVESIGLFLKKKWAEYFTLFVTGSLIPFEIYELIEKSSFLKILIIVLNVLIVLFLYKRIYSKE